MKTRNGVGDQQAQVEVVCGIRGVMKEKDVKVGVIGQQAKDVVALAPNGNIEEEMQTNVEVGEIFTIINVSRIEVELQKTIDIIEDQEIVALGQENANGDVELRVQIDGGDIMYLIIINCHTHPLQLRGWVGFLFVKFVITILSLLVILKPLPTPPSFSMDKVGGAFFFVLNLQAIL